MHAVAVCDWHVAVLDAATATKVCCNYRRRSAAVELAVVCDAHARQPHMCVVRCTVATNCRIARDAVVK